MFYPVIQLSTKYTLNQWEKEYFKCPVSARDSSQKKKPDDVYYYTCRMDLK